MFSFFKKKSKEVVEEIPVEIQRDYEDASKIAAYFKEETGIFFESDRSIIKSKLSIFCKKRDIYSFDALLEKVQRDASLKQEFINELTTNETYFYRELEQIERVVELVNANPNQNIKILCAPCATGEEPYSIAMALLESHTSKNFSILGIDINSQALKHAQVASYTKRHVQKLSANLIARYFVKEEEQYKVTEQVKSKVIFQIANIFDDDFTKIGKFDYVFSRNMLIYFDKETKLKAKSILESLRKDSSVAVYFGHADLF